MPDRKRAGGVTGVQTCALPIYSMLSGPMAVTWVTYSPDFAQWKWGVPPGRTMTAPGGDARPEEGRGGDWSADVCSSDLFDVEWPDGRDLGDVLTGFCPVEMGGTAGQDDDGPRRVCQTGRGPGG